MLIYLKTEHLFIILNRSLEFITGHLRSNVNVSTLRMLGSAIVFMFTDLRTLREQRGVRVAI